MFLAATLRSSGQIPPPQIQEIKQFRSRPRHQNYTGSDRICKKVTSSYLASQKDQETTGSISGVDRELPRDQNEQEMKCVTLRFDRELAHG